MTPRELIGRRVELEALRGAFAAAEHGPAAVLVRGDAGMGKSSLLQHFVRNVRGTMTIEVQGLELETDVDYGLVDQILRCAGSDTGVLSDRMSHVGAGCRSSDDWAICRPTGQCLS